MGKHRNSIITNDLEHCFICGHSHAHIHHIFYGKNRRNADEDGLIIGLCYYHHNGSDEGVHFNKPLDRALKELGQAEYEKTHTRQQFITRYNKSYL